MAAHAGDVPRRTVGGKEIGRAAPLADSQEPDQGAKVKMGSGAQRYRYQRITTSTHPELLLTIHWIGMYTGAVTIRTCSGITPRRTIPNHGP